MNSDARQLRRNSIEPRIGIVQLIFGIIYTGITAVALLLAREVYANTGEQPWLQYFFAVLFTIMAVKSFVICIWIRTLMARGVPTTGTVTAVVPRNGITFVRGYVDDGEGQQIEIESRLVGERIAGELEAVLKTRGHRLPALVVRGSRGRMRAMFDIRTRAGFLDEEYVKFLSDTREKDMAAESFSAAEHPAEAQNSQAAAPANHERP